MGQVERELNWQKRMRIAKKTNNNMIDKGMTGSHSPEFFDKLCEGFWLDINVTKNGITSPKKMRMILD